MRLLIHGINGTMGKFVEEVALEHTEIELVGGIDANTTRNYSFPVFQNIKSCDVEADVIVDFSHHSLIHGLLDYAIDHQVATVICTTGLDSKVLAHIDQAKTEVAIFKSGNMSLGINLLIHLAQKASQVLAEQFDIEVVEKHHNQKVDAPSGTAKMIASAINQTLDQNKSFIYGREDNNRKRQREEIGIHSIRGGTIVGDHDVLFAGPDETIQLSHSAQSKKVFAEGAITAALFLRHKKTGLYDMNHIFN